MAFSLLVVMLALCLGAQGKNLTRTLLVNDIQATGAMCIDGSPAGYYIRRGTGEGARKYVLYLHGGGLCFSLEDCFKRSFTELGSSRSWPEAASAGGILSDDPAMNPDFYTWNTVMMMYCDGGFYSGDLAEAAVFNGTKLYFRGYRNLKAMIEHLMENEGLSEATNVILMGSSAGGVAVYLHADFVKTMLSESVQDYKVMADAGYIIDIISVNGDNLLGGNATGVTKLQNIDEAFNPACKAKYEGTDDTWKCLFPHENYNHIKTPLFVLNSKVDSLILRTYYGQPCMPPLCNSQGKADLKNYEKIFAEQLQPVFNSPTTNGYFLDTCFTHVQSTDDESWNKHAINRVTIATSFGDWYFNRSQKTRLMDCETYPCNLTCMKI